MKIDVQCIAKYKRWYQVMFLVNGKFNDVLIVKEETPEEVNE